MSVLSKPSLGTWDKFTCSCYEIGHTWNPSCVGTNKNVIKHGFVFSAKVYFTLYLLETMLKMRNKKHRNVKSFAVYLRNALQSSVFLTTNAVTFMSCFCLFGKLFGGYYYPFGFIVGVCSCFLSIFVERKARRALLALYLTNLATECLFKMAVSRNLVSPIKNFEVAIFACSSAVMMSLFRTEGGLPEYIRRPLAWFVGENTTKSTSEESGNKLNASVAVLKMIKRFTNIGPRHKKCTHERTCFGNAAQVGIRNFTIGFALQFVLNLRKFMRHRQWSLLADFQLSKFLAGFALLYQSSSCLLRYKTNDDSSKFHGAISGLIAGLSSFYYKSTSISLYFFYKVLETLYFKGVEKRVLPYFYHGDAALYCASMGLLFHAMVFEPHTVRPSYYNFLCGLSHNKFPEMFRRVLDIFGTKASQLHPNFIPALDPCFITQPYVREVMAKYAHLATKSSLS